MKTKKICSALLAICLLVSVMVVIPASARDYVSNPIIVEGKTLYAGGVNIDVVVREYSTLTKSKPVAHYEYNEEVGDNIQLASTINPPNGGQYVSVTFYAKANQVAINAAGFMLCLGYNQADLVPINYLGGSIATDVYNHIIVDPLLYCQHYDSAAYPNGFPALSSPLSSMNTTEHYVNYVITPPAAQVITINAGDKVALCTGYFKKTTASTVLHGDSLYFTKSATGFTGWGYNGHEVMQQQYQASGAHQYIIPEAFRMTQLGPQFVSIMNPVVINPTSANPDADILAAVTDAGSVGGTSVTYTGITNGKGTVSGGAYTKNQNIVGVINDKVNFEVKNAGGTVVATGCMDVTYGENVSDAKKFNKAGTWDGDTQISSVIALDKATVTAYAIANTKFKLELSMGKGFGRTIVTVKDEDDNILAVDKLDTFFVTDTTASFIIKNKASNSDFVVPTNGIYTVEVEVNGTNISDKLSGINDASNKIAISAFEIVENE